jgi:hypothetical protein
VSLPLFATLDKLCLLPAFAPPEEWNTRYCNTHWVDWQLSLGTAAYQLGDLEGWNTILRLYSPIEPWFDKTWLPGEIELQP